jgi:S-adenosylmethionine decarboxylase
MAYHDTLFQLGMDLTRSSTAQKEDHGVSARVAHHTEKTRERHGARYAGTHLFVDLIGAERLDEMEHIERTLKRCVDAAGATLLHTHLHQFTPTGGVAGVAVLAESHISIHSWPEERFASLDVFMSGDANPHAIVEVLRREFRATDVVVKEHKRGEDLGRLSALPPPRRATKPARQRKAA